MNTKKPKLRELTLTRGTIVEGEKEKRGTQLKLPASQAAGIVSSNRGVYGHHPIEKLDELAPDAIPSSAEAEGKKAKAGK